MTREPMRGSEVDAAVASLPGWDVVDGKLHRLSQFVDFRAALAFMNAVGDAAETANHHPEWFNVYNRVEVWMTTHDAGGITIKDLDLARVMNSLASKLS